MGIQFSRINPEGDGDDATSVSSGADGANQRKGTSFFSFFREEYIEPPMPTLGRPVDFDLMESRTRNVKKTLRMMMKVVNADVEAVHKESTEIPVSHEIERVQVTDEIRDRIALRRSKKADKLFVAKNLENIQRCLALRRSALNMMNHNYMSATVRQLEPVQTDEARTIMKL